MISRVEGLKRKVRSHPNDYLKDVMLTVSQQLSELSDKSTLPTHGVLKKRFQHLDALESMSGREDAQWDAWADTRIDRWIVDWSLRNGRERTAMQLSKDKGIEVSCYYSIRSVIADLV